MPSNDATPVGANVLWAEQVLDEYQNRGEPRDEQFFVLKARLHAIQKNPDEALRTAETCAATGVAQLRLYIPALVSFAAAGTACYGPNFNLPFNPSHSPP